MAHGMGSMADPYGTETFGTGAGAYGADGQAAGVRTVRLQFRGGALPMFGRVLLAVICSLLVLPAAWGAVPMVRWFIENIEWSDGSQARFEGQPGEVWHLFALAGLIGYLPLVIQQVFGDAFLLSVGAALVMALLMSVVAVPLWRWYASRTRIGQVADLQFDGDIPTYAGFNVLMQLAAYTVIGWAWVVTAMQRWLMRHIRGNEVSFEFTASGLGVLWRVIVFTLASMFIIPMPWMLRWLTSWLVEQTVMHRTDSTARPPTY